MRNSKGQYVKGFRQSPTTEFKKGEHWRPHAQFREADYLIEQYVNLGRSAGDIAREHGVTDAAIIFWLRKHGIARRTVSEARKLKKWGLKGPVNGMFGRTGSKNPNWRGGCTPERQLFYASSEWARARDAAWERDSSRCQKCGRIKQSCDGVEFHLHHIVPFRVVHLRADVDNLILLCDVCHDWVHSRKNVNREYCGRKWFRKIRGRSA